MSAPTLADQAAAVQRCHDDVRNLNRSLEKAHGMGVLLQVGGLFRYHEKDVPVVELKAHIRVDPGKEASICTHALMVRPMNPVRLECSLPGGHDGPHEALSPGDPLANDEGKRLWV